jgi:hypothetical protein
MFSLPLAERAARSAMTPTAIGDRGTSIRQIEKLAPAAWADVALHYLAGPRRTKQGAGGAGEAVLRLVLILRLGLRHLLLRHRPRHPEDDRCTGEHRQQHIPP